QAVNTWARPTPRTVGGELQRDERAEVVYAEIWSPVTGAPASEEELKKIIPVLDGDKYGEYVSLSGIRSSVMAPPKGRIWGAKLYSFGTPMSSNPLLSTTLKYSESITVETLVGATTAITQDYRIRLWGYIYKVGELPRVFGTMGGGIPGHPDLFALLVDRARGRELPIRKATGGIPVNGDTWRTLPGGKDQSIPKINPLIRYAYNLLHTDGKSGDYQFRYQTGNVAETEENLYFDLDSLDAILVEGIGIRPDAAGNLAKTALKIAGDYHPKGLIPTTLTNNPLHFGWADPFFPDTIPLYYAIPKLERPYLIWNEIGALIAQDGGTAVVINALITALSGIRIEMKGG
ncbi:unnamed protein product, partial [marine sediment metagenome]